MKSKFFVLTFSIVLLASLTLSVFAVSPSITTPLQQTTYRWVGGSSGEYSLAFPLQLPAGVADLKLTVQRTKGEGGKIGVYDGSSYLYEAGVTDSPQSILASSYPGGINLTWSTAVHERADFKLTVEYIYPVSVVPAFANPVANGSYSVSGLVGDSVDVNMYFTKDHPKIFTFSNVNANDGTFLSYAISSGDGQLTYHDIGVLVDGTSIYTSDYPIANFFTVRNKGSTPVSYSVSVSESEIDKSSGIASSIWETCLTMGTAFISWVTTGSNFIALIPLALMILVFAILSLRKLIKGV